MAYKILNLYRDLPGNHCGECGKSGCFAFTGAVFLEGASLAACPRLTPGAAAAITARMAPVEGESGTKEPAQRAALRDRFRTADWRALARIAGGSFPDGPGGTARLVVLGRGFRVSPKGVQRADAEPTPRVEIAVLDHLLRGHSGVPAARWISYRDLPGTAGWSKAFRACIDRLAPTFGGRLAALDAAALALGAQEEPKGSASRAYRVPTLPRVGVLLRFWDREEDPEGRTAVLHPAYGRFTASGDFDARAEIQVDAEVLSGVCPEVLYFLVEALVDRLIEEGATEDAPRG